MTWDPGHHVMYVCTGCNFSKSAAKTHGTRAGRALWDAVRAEAVRRGGAAVHLDPVACLSVCRDACAVALIAPRKYASTFGSVEPKAAAASDLLDMARLYVDRLTGHVDRRERPRFARRLISRVPPPEFDPDRDDDALDPRMAAPVPKPMRGQPICRSRATGPDRVRRRRSQSTAKVANDRAKCA